MSSGLKLLLNRRNWLKITMMCVRMEPSFVRKLLAVMKRMDKSRFRSLNEVIESPDYKKLRELKKTHGITPGRM